MRDFNFDNGILHIKVNGYGDELLLDSTDRSVFQGFAKMYDEIQIIAEEAGAEVKQIKDRHTDQNSVDCVKDLIDASIKHVTRIMEKLDEVLGEGFTRKVFRENYELNPDFVPDELAITELLEALVPVMEDAYGERIKRNKSKYSATKKGKHTKSKDELITEYKEKNGIE